MKTQVYRGFGKYFTIYLVIIFFGCKHQEKSGTSTDSLGSCKSCDIIEVVNTEKNIAIVKEDQIERFLCVIKTECQNNVEFTEYSNEVLFMLIDKRTDLFFKVFSKAASIEKKYILFQIRNPLLDYNMDELILKVEKNNGDSIVKKQIISALRNL